MPKFGPFGGFSSRMLSNPDVKQVDEVDEVSKASASGRWPLLNQSEENLTWQVHPVSDPSLSRVPKGKKRGTYIGRVAIKSDGYFKLTGQPFGMIEGIHVRYCTPIHRKDGYSYAKGTLASLSSLKREGPPQAQLGEGV